MKHLLTAFSLLSTGVLSLSDSQCTNTHQCSRRLHSDQAFVLRGSLDSKVKLEHVRNLVQEQDPVSEWLKEFLDVVIEDVVQVDVLKGKIINTATPYLDLSNIYNPASGKVKICAPFREEKVKIVTQILLLVFPRETAALHLLVVPAAGI